MVGAEERKWTKEQKEEISEELVSMVAHLLVCELHQQSHISEELVSMVA